GKDQAGELIWQFILPDPRQGHFTHLLVGETNLIVLTSRNRAYSLIKSTGKVQWGSVLGEGQMQNVEKVDNLLVVRLLTLTRRQQSMVVTLRLADGEMVSRIIEDQEPHFAGGLPESIGPMPGDLAELSAAEKALAQRISDSNPSGNLKGPSKPLKSGGVSNF
ncbi:MAG: hypothetical protein KDD43_07330, partial [Bdellovibrionales bacterium]|nr:hypothetical protein [Bdellovibrionales bacterium]